MKASTLIALSTELAAARAKFPDPSFLSLALAEESGEAVKAALDFRQGKGTAEEFRKECIQTAAMAIRLLEEGDPALFAPPLMAELVFQEEPSVDLRVIEPATADQPESELHGVISEPPAAAAPAADPAGGGVAAGATPPASTKFGRVNS